jgi:putative serine protease PepD
MFRSGLGMLRFARPVAPLVAAMLAAGGGVVAVSRATDSTGSQPPAGPAEQQGLALQSAFVGVVSSVSPSVVQIEDRRGLGSGIVLDKAGHIVTNNHVVTGAKAFTVTTRDGKRYRARLVGSFPPDDLAVIKVSAAHLRPASFADSSKLRVGDLAIAIGNPLGLRSSVTQGIVSAFRQGMVEQGGKVALPSVIQTSAAINPGNSGGALVDITDRVIGIPTLAATDPELGGSAPGIGFAIPSNLVADIAGQIVAHGKVVHSHRAYLGIRVGDTNGNGVLVGAVTPRGAAAKAGIRAGDTIKSVHHSPTPTTLALAAVLAELRPGQKVPVVVIHENGAKAIVQATLGAYPGS